MNRGDQTPLRGLWWVIGALCLLLVSCPGRVAAQEPSDEDLKARVESILARSEFRRVRRLLDSDLAREAAQRLPKVNPNSGSGDGDGGGPEANGGAGQPGRDQGRAPGDRAPPERADGDSSGWSGGGAMSAFAGAVGSVLQVLAWVLLAVVVVGMLALVIHAWLNREKRVRETVAPLDAAVPDAAPVAPPGDTPADVWLARARDLAARGEYREAIGQLVLGMMGHIERRGLIRFRQGLTHRDYLRAAGPRPTLRTSLRTLVGIYEPICFGRRDAGPEHFESSVAGYLEGLADAA